MVFVVPSLVSADRTSFPTKCLANEKYLTEEMPPLTVAWKTATISLTDIINQGYDVMDQDSLNPDLGVSPLPRKQGSGTRVRGAC